MPRTASPRLAPPQPPPPPPHPPPPPNPSHTPPPTPNPSRCPALTVSMILTCVIGLLADPCPADQVGPLPACLPARACVRACVPVCLSRSLALSICTHAPHTHIHIWIRWLCCGPRWQRCTGATARASTKPPPSGRASMRSRRVAPRAESWIRWLPHTPLRQYCILTSAAASRQLNVNVYRTIRLDISVCHMHICQAVESDCRVSRDGKVGGKERCGRAVRCARLSFLPNTMPPPLTQPEV
jgi:hypothetical protein